MNGFALVSDSQRKAAESGMISREEADKKCRVYDFLAACDKEDLYILFDSSALNSKSLFEKGRRGAYCGRKDY